MTPPLLLISLFALLMMAGVGAALVVETKRQQRFAARLRSIRQSIAGVPEAPEVTGPLLLRLVSRLGAAVAKSGLLSPRTLGELEHTLRLAGFRPGQGLGLFVGSKMLLLPLLPALMIALHPPVSSFMHNVLVFGSAIVGLLAPDQLVRWLRKRHLRAVDQGLPDALDLMVICSDAGLSLEPALSRVATEIRPAHPAVAEELALTANELRITADIRIAFGNAGERTGLVGIKRLATTLAQSLQYGTPLAHALRTLSAEMRQEMLTRFEARAARLPVLLTVPMIMFILPCVFLIVGGPAILQVMHLVKH